MTHTGIAVLESGWWRKSNVSVRGLFELIANLSTGNPNAYHYEMANSEVAIKEAVPRIATYRECRYLTLAMHGDEQGKTLTLLNGDELTKRELRDLLVEIHRTQGAKLRGLHLGSCYFGTDDLADYLFRSDIGINWIAGYSKEIDFIESSAMDLLFFNELLRWSDVTEIQRIEQVASRVSEIAPGLVSSLGFGIFTRKRAVGGAKNLLRLANEEP